MKFATQISPQDTETPLITAGKDTGITGLAFSIETIVTNIYYGTISSQYSVWV